TATLASIMVARKIQEGRGLEKVTLRRHIVVCGWNQYAERVLDGLVNTPESPVAVVLVNELHEEAINEILLRYRDHGVRFVRGDPATEAALDRANVREARAAIVLADTAHGFDTASDERTMLVTLALNSVHPGIDITAEALDLRSEAHLRRAGADDIVISGEFNGFLLSSAATASGISDVVRQMLSLEGTRLRRATIPPELVGHTFGEMFQALRSQSGFMTLAVVTENKGLTLNDLLTDDYSLIDSFIKQQFTEAGTEYLRFAEGATRVLVNPPDSLLIGADDVAIGIPREA
ncbi:MAG: Potassium channel family protein, partial [Chloroflexi bacterium]|nr:Potassium channel family protein [Chloroflexota bacterium]